MTIFRTATKQAIKEIIEENAFDGKYGLILSEDGLEAITDKVVDLFEMTLQLRSHTAQMSSGQTKSPTMSQFEEKPNSLPRVKSAAEIYDTPPVARNPELPQPLALDLKLPRKKVIMSDAEKDKFNR